jgi:hypothetical protein
MTVGDPEASAGRDRRTLTVPFPIIVARGRSGTTLLRAMLDSHPQMAVPPESHFLVRLGKRRRRYVRGGRFALQTFVDDLFKQYGVRRWGLDASTVRERLAASDVGDYAAAMREVFSLYTESQGKTRFAEKTPINVLHIPFLSRMFPEARFIHLIRDGRDVALSYLDTDFGAESVGEAAIYWRRFVRTGRHDGQTLGEDRYREVRYEDLLDDPEGTLRMVCAFVDLPYDPSMLLYHRRTEELMKTLSHREHHQRLHLPPTAGLRDWRRDMRREDVQLFEAIAGDALEWFGYERSGPSIAPSIQLKAWRVRIEVWAQRLRRRIRKGPLGDRSISRRSSSSRLAAGTGLDMSAVGESR